MGTDIHLMVGVREPSGQWTAVRLPESQWSSKPVHPEYNFFIRNYDLFSILAGVRGGQPPIAEPRGLPPGLSEGGRLLESEQLDYDEGNEMLGTSWLGDHSHSWLTLAELQAYDWNQEAKEPRWVLHKTCADCAGSFYSEFMPALAKLGKPEDVRIVFGFDS